MKSLFHSGRGLGLLMDLNWDRCVFALSLTFALIFAGWIASI